METPLNLKHEDKAGTGCVPSPRRMRTGKHWSFRTPYLTPVPTSVGSLKRDLKVDTSTGSSWFASSERFLCDPCKNPFLGDTMNSPDQEQPKSMLEKRLQELENPTSCWEKNLSEETMEKTGNEFGNSQFKASFWKSQLIFE